MVDSGVINENLFLVAPGERLPSFDKLKREGKSQVERLGEYLGTIIDANGARILAGPAQHIIDSAEILADKISNAEYRGELEKFQSIRTHGTYTAWELEQGRPLVKTVKRQLTDYDVCIIVGPSKTLGIVALALADEVGIEIPSELTGNDSLLKQGIVAHKREQGDLDMSDEQALSEMEINPTTSRLLPFIEPACALAISTTTKKKSMRYVRPE